MISLPPQRLSYKEKIKDDYEWAKDTINAIISENEITLAHDITVPTETRARKRYQKKLAAYRLYNNILDQERYQKECDVMGIATGKFQEEIQPYNKIPTKIQVLLGEEYRRPFNYQVVAADSDGIRKKDALRKEMLRDELEQRIQEYIQYLQEQFSPQNQEAFQQLSPEEQQEAQQQIDQNIQELASRVFNDKELLKFQKSTFLEDREILLTKILRYLEMAQGIREKMNDSFKHGLIAGEEFVWVGVENSEPVVKVLNPLGMFYHKSADTKYVQDGVAAGYRTMMNIADIIDIYHDYLSETDKEELENRVYQYRNQKGPSKKMTYPKNSVHDELQSKIYDQQTETGLYGEYSTLSDLSVAHVEWRSEKRIYFISYPDPETGEIIKDMVSEEFEIPTYAEKTITTVRGVKKTTYTFDEYEVEEAWIPEVWEGTRIGHDIYVNIGPKSQQFRSIDNPRRVKLGYHGVVYNNTNADSVSLVERMEPFQFLFFIVAHKLKQLVAKDKAPLLHIDQSMIPAEIGVEKTMYYMNLLDIDFFNPLQNAEQPGSHQRGKAVGATPRSTMQQVMGYVNLLDAIDRQISSVAGITHQREGQTRHSEAVTNAQQDLAQSSTITEAVYFMPHFEVWKSVLESLIDVTQDAWKDSSIVKQYVLDDQSLEVLNLSGNEISHGCYNVFLSNSYKDAETFETLKTFIQPLLQNDRAKMSDIIAMVKATSVSQLSQQIKASEAEMQQQLEQQQQHEQQMQQMQLQAKKEEIEDMQAHQMQIEQLKAQVELQKAQLDALVKLQTAEEANQTKVAQLMQDYEDNKTSLELELVKLSQQRELKEKEIQAKKSSSPQ